MDNQYPPADDGIAVLITYAGFDPDRSIGLGLLIASTLDELALLLEECSQDKTYQEACQDIATRLQHGSESSRKTIIQRIVAKCRDWQEQSLETTFQIRNDLPSTPEGESSSVFVVDPKDEMSAEDQKKRRQRQQDHLKHSKFCFPSFSSKSAVH